MINFYKMVVLISTGMNIAQTLYKFSSLQRAKLLRSAPVKSALSVPKTSLRLVQYPQPAHITTKHNKVSILYIVYLKK